MMDATTDAPADTPEAVNPSSTMGSADQRMPPTSQMEAANQPLYSTDTISASADSLRRPGLVTFAAIIMFVLAGFQVTWALVQFSSAAWIRNTTYGAFGGYLWAWGILDLLYAAVLLYAGYDILRGGRTGQILGLIVVCLSAVRWFFYLPAAPWMAVVIIALDVLTIYALAAHSDFFESRQLNPAS